MTDNIKSQRERWFKEHPFCYWCGCKLVLFEQKRHQPCPDNMATIDHLRPKGHPDRKEHNRFALWRRVLACHLCNGKRDKEFNAQQSLEYLWRQSGQWYRMLKTTGMLNEVEP